MNEQEALIFARCVACIARAPGFSHPDVPPMVRAGFALALALAIAHAMPTRAIPAFAMALVSELAVGFALGSAASAIYDAAYAGGRAVDDYVGIRGAVPTAGAASGSGFGRLWSLLFAVGFFVLGGVRLAIEGLWESFSMLPPGTLVAGESLATLGVATLATVARTGAVVAAPAIAAAFAAQLALGSAARVVPKLSSFSLTFPVVFACALIATLVVVPTLWLRAGSPWTGLRFLVGH